MKILNITVCLLCIFLSSVHSKEISKNVLTNDARIHLQKKGIIVHGLTSKISIPNTDSTKQRENILRIDVSFDLSKSGIKPIWMDKSPISDFLSNATISNIMTEDFEGTFPGEKWQRNGDPTWGKVNNNSHSGDYSIWCAKDSSKGIDPGQGYPRDWKSYPNNCSSMIIYGPFDLRDVNYSQLKFWHYLDVEFKKDWLFAMSSIDGNNFQGIGISQEGGYYGVTWKEEILHLSNVPVLGNITGQSKVWIAFLFVSDDHTTNDLGAYLDDIEITKRQVLGTPLAGSIRGVLSSSDNPHIIVYNTGVAENVTLIIEPGVEIRSEEDMAFFVNGTLKANGAVNDTIVFKSALEEPQYGDWGGLWISSTDNDSCVLSYCKVLHGGHKMTVHGFQGNIVCFSNKIKILNTKTTDIYCYGASPFIKKNDLISISCNSSSDPIIENNYVQSISLGSYSDPIIKNNIIEGGGVHSSGGDPIIIGNTIRNCKYGITAYANTLIDQSANLTIINNKIINCERAIELRQWAKYTYIIGNIIAGNKFGIIHQRSDFKKMIIINNVIINNSHDAILSMGGIESEHIILNNVIANNTRYGISVPSETNISIMYNDFFNNTSNYRLLEIDSLGIINQTNFNGNECDKFYNIYLDPQFSDEDSSEFKLEANSPCIDAGNSHLSYNDTDGTINDIGAYGGSRIVMFPTKLNFDSVEVNLNKHMGIGIYNFRDSLFTVDNISLSDNINFSISETGPLSIPAYKSGGCTVTFNPTSVDTFLSTLRILSSAFIGNNYSDIKLEGVGFWAGSVVSGNAKGIWTFSQSPYIVNGTITIEENDTLIVEPGVKILFNGYYRLNVNGALMAVGTSTDSIIFDYFGHTSGNGWWGINLFNKHTISRIEYCKIQHVDGGLGTIYCSSSSPIISNNTKIGRAHV